MRAASRIRPGRHWPARILAFFAVPAAGLCQFNVSFYDRTPNTRATLAGAKTVVGYRLSPDARSILGGSSGRALIRLPAAHRQAAPQLLGKLQHGVDIELFVGWVVPESQPEGIQHHIEIYRGRRGGEAAFVHDFILTGAPGAGVSFFQPPDDRDAPCVLIDIQGGAYWGSTYLLAPDRQSVEKLFESSDYEFSDLDRDGVYELIAWSRRPFDLRCRFGIFWVRFYPEVFVRSGASYQKVWPPSDWAAEDGQLEDLFRSHATEGVPRGANFQIVGGFADLDGDGSAELIVLQDRLIEQSTQTLAVYRLERGLFRPMAQTPLPPQRIAYLLWGIRNSPGGKQILVRTATPAKCEAGGDPKGPGTAQAAYAFHGDRLQLVQR